jgi:FdhE protein
MAGGFLRQWLGKSELLRPDVAEAIAELDRASIERATLSPSLKLLRSLLPRLYEDLPEPPSVALDRDSAGAKLAAGMPLLRGEKLTLEGPAHNRRWLRLCESLEPQAGAAARGLASAVKEDRLQPAALLQEVLAGRPEAVAAQAEELGWDGGLTATLVRLHWFPVLTSVQIALAPLRGGAPWEYGYCPVCGTSPLLAELRGLEQGRFLRCGLCAAAWEVTRHLCPFCGTRDHHALGYLQLAGEETRFRVTTCDACGHYVKTIATLAELAGPSLLAADAATLHLDLAAAERGYIA